MKWRLQSVITVISALCQAASAEAQPGALLSPILSAPSEVLTVDVGNRDWGPAALFGTTLVAGGPSGKAGLFGVDAVSGKLKWTFRPTDFGPGVSTAPVLVKDLVIVPMGATAVGAVVAVSLATGKLVWRGLDPMLDADVAVSGSQILIMGKDGALHALDAATGREQWSVPLSGNNRGCVSRPLVSDGVVYLTATVSTTAPGEPRAYALFALDASNGQERWRTIVRLEGQRGSVCLTQPILDGDAIYASGEHAIFAFDTRTGRSRWKPTERKGMVNGKLRKFTLSTLVDAGSTVIGMSDTSLVAIEKSSGKVAWELPGGYRPLHPSMAVAGSVLYFQGSPIIAPAKAERGTLHALDFERREMLWSFSRPTAAANWAFGSVLAIDGALWVDSYKAMVKLK